MYSIGCDQISLKKIVGTCVNFFMYSIFNRLSVLNEHNLMLTSFYLILMIKVVFSLRESFRKLFGPPKAKSTFVKVSQSLN